MILGWLEGLFQGTQLTLQLEAARAFSELATAKFRKRRTPELESRKGPYL